MLCINITRPKLTSSNVINRMKPDSYITSAYSCINVFPGAIHVFMKN